MNLHNATSTFVVRVPIQKKKNVLKSDGYHIAAGVRILALTNVLQDQTLKKGLKCMSDKGLT